MNIKNEVLKKAYEGSYYTIVGVGGDINEWKTGYQEMLDENGIGKISEWIQFSGKDMNDAFGFVGGDRLSDNVTFLAFSLDGLDGAKLAMFKLRMQDRWFDDIVNNLLNS